MYNYGTPKLSGVFDVYEAEQYNTLYISLL